MTFNLTLEMSEYNCRLPLFLTKMADMLLTVTCSGRRLKMKLYH